MPSSSTPAPAQATENSERRKRKPGGTNGTLISIVLSISLFLSLLQLFDPATHEKPPSVVEIGLKDFAKGRIKEEFKEVTHEEVSPGREPILQLLKEADVLDTLNPEQLTKLPKWQHVVDLYGDKVIIVGKERCADFRKKVALPDRKVGVAGLFNTGTNLLDLHLQRNVHGVENLWQVPWGKHRMAEVKWNHTANGSAKYKKENVLPVVIVRDPLAWMQSMCGNPYAAHWRHEKHHCPNMIPNEEDKNHFRNLKDVFQVRVNFDKTSKYSFNSLAHMWSEWHLQYMDADYPVLFIRFEDLVFQTRAVLWEIADCLGATLSEPLHYQVKTSKAHGSGTGFVKAIIKTSDADLRLHNLTQADIEYATEHLEPFLMNTFRYRSPIDGVPST